MMPSIDATESQSPTDVQIAALELREAYSEKASIVASDRAHMAWEQRNFHRRDFWVAVFLEIKETNTHSLSSSQEKTLLHSL